MYMRKNNKHNYWTKL